MEISRTLWYPHHVVVDQDKYPIWRDYANKFSAISVKQDGRHSQCFRKYCSTNYSNAVQAMLSRFDVQVSNHNTLLFFGFFEAI